MKVVFKQQEITTRLGEILSKNEKKQLRIAETEKYAHVTYFFNGGFEKPFEGEDRIVISSKNTPSYADKPAMSAREVTEKLLEKIDEDKYDFILVNYANPDMVGHTGVLEAGVKSLEFTDECLGELMSKVLEKEGSLLITADHGNVEEMVNLYSGEPDTEHSTNPVPCWLVTPNNYREKNMGPEEEMKVGGMLVDIAPTILDFFDIAPPEGMVGRSLREILK